MNYLTIDQDVIPYIIEVKNNKNTYFYFKKEGYIKINKSKRQSTKEILSYIRKNKDMFIQKLSKVNITIEDRGYYLLGEKYETIYNDDFSFDKERKILYTNNSDEHKSILKQIEKRLMIDLLDSLKQKYIENKFIDIKDISLKTRYTKTRHGSCNARTKSININLNLIHYDYAFIEYVFLHEITHLKVQNHQKQFYELFIKLCPDYKEKRKKLKEIYR